jgi:hypothetical protein
MAPVDVSIARPDGSSGLTVKPVVAPPDIVGEFGAIASKRVYPTIPTSEPGLEE